MAESHVLDSEPRLDTAGKVLCRAREAAGFARADVASLTKIPERHLLAIEQDNFGALPARAYAVGFSRTYARALGLDEATIAGMVRAQLDGSTAEPSPRAATFEPGDPARIPSSAFAWITAVLALAVIVAGFMFWRSYYSPAAELPPIVADAPAAAPPAAATAAPAASGQVVFTALEQGVWVKFYDAGGQLLQKELAQGESYAVPGTANGPMIWTARPQALAITVDGKPVPKLSEKQTTLKDVPITAAALLARAAVAATPAANGSAIAATTSRRPVPPTVQPASPPTPPTAAAATAASAPEPSTVSQ
ncbi:MAG: RodZ domain-containing protein [Novosphingobium sp.]